MLEKLQKIPLVSTIIISEKQICKQPNNPYHYPKNACTCYPKSKQKNIQNKRKNKNTGRNLSCPPTYHVKLSNSESNVSSSDVSSSSSSSSTSAVPPFTASFSCDAESFVLEHPDTKSNAIIPIKSKFLCISIISLCEVIIIYKC